MDARKMRFHNLGRGKLLLAQALRHFGNAQRVQFAHGLASLCALPELRQVKFRFAPFWRAENRLTCGNANQTIKSAASPDSRKARRTRPIHVATPRPCFSSCCISSRFRRGDAASRNQISCSAVIRRRATAPWRKALLAASPAPQYPGRRLPQPAAPRRRPEIFRACPPLRPPIRHCPPQSRYRPSRPAKAGGRARLASRGDSLAPQGSLRLDDRHAQMPHFFHDILAEAVCVGELRARIVKSV